jgi:hypothetical protein
MIQLFDGPMTTNQTKLERKDGIASNKKKAYICTQFNYKLQS